MSWQTRYLERFYNPASGWVDGTTEFLSFCRESIPGGSRVLEVGAGPSNSFSRRLGGEFELHGVDIDPVVLSNDALRSASVMNGKKFELPSASYHACVSSFVLEHVEDPEAHLAEVRRVLMPGGVYLFRTPNKWHYVAMVAGLTPQWFHELVANRLRRLPADQHAPWPTFYRMNSRDDLARVASRVGLSVEVLRMVEKEPSYGMSSRGLFLSFMAYERLVNSTEFAQPLRANIFGRLRTPR